MTAAALEVFLAELLEIMAVDKSVVTGENSGDKLQAPDTASWVMARARIGQGRFRADLLTFWQGQCALTEVSAPELLRASHIKSWEKSDNRERLDVFNGLLLAVHLDALFDRALITFQNSGEMLVSKRLAAGERTVFGLESVSQKLLLNVAHLEYLRHHQDRFEASEQKC